MIKACSLLLIYPPPLPPWILSSHLSQMCISVDPRLISKAVYDYPKKYGLKSYTSVQNFFRPLVRSGEILKEVDLDGKVVVVTGANSGLGEWSVTGTNFG